MYRSVLLLTYLFSTFILIAPKASNKASVSKTDIVIFGKKTSRDSVQIVTPNIELFDRSNPALNYNRRETTRKFIKQLLIDEYSDLNYVELPILYEDYLTINKLLENELYTKSVKPKSMVSLSDKLITDGKKYSLLVNYNGRYGKSKTNPYHQPEGGVVYIGIINNKDKLLEKAIGYKYNFSPFNEKESEKLILKTIRKLIK